MQKPVAVLLFEAQNTRALKRFVCKLLWFLFCRRFCQQNWYDAANQLNTSSISRYFYNHASRSQKGKILRWNKQAGQQADLAKQCSECSLPANKWTTKEQNAHSSWLCLVVVQPTVTQSSFTLNSSAPSDFHLFGFFEDENGQEFFLCFHLYIKKN